MLFEQPVLRTDHVKEEDGSGTLTASAATRSGGVGAYILVVGGMQDLTDYQGPELPPGDDTIFVAEKYSTPTSETAGCGVGRGLDEWVRGPSLVGGPRSFVSAAAWQDCVVVFGGFDASGPCRTIMWFDANAGSAWRRAASLDLKTPRACSGAACLGERFFLVGGCHKTLRDSSESVISLDARLIAQAHREAAAAGLGTGGEKCRQTEGGWRQEANLKRARARHAVVAAQGKLWAIGGHSAGVLLDSVEWLDPLAADAQWQEEAALQLPFGRLGMAAAVAGGRLYILGGYGGAQSQQERQEQLASVLSIDLVEHGTGWRQEPPMLTGRSGHCAIAAGSIIYVLGGADSQGRKMGTTEMFDTVLGVWSHGPSLAQPRFAATAVIMGGNKVATEDATA